MKTRATGVRWPIENVASATSMNGTTAKQRNNATVKKRARERRAQDEQQARTMPKNASVIATNLVARN